ncbi:MAG: exo-alpha-sialidase [Chloroflexi bacterium]|nr:exo-alpha-sialidase [Chloroflexota bacterium]MCI0576202.1 exo-alpha-sialidase [Chloroflexota bacterium]MCI0645504.1 exo-alpha-sialidase [Chloroflexota bacterium]MCI0730643.1 exo-alpha-sialidase [Chloroflexota bacterium]
MLRNNRFRLSWLLLLALFLGLALWLRRPVAADPAPLAPLALPRWSAPQLISTSSTSGASLPLVRSAPNGDVMVIYSHKIGAIRNPYYRESTNDGSTWSAPAPMRTTAEDVPEYDFTYNNTGGANAVWVEEEVAGSSLYHARRTQWPSGLSPITVTTQVIEDPAITIAANDSLHVVWAQSDNLHRIYYARSTNNGTNWTIWPPLDTAFQHSIEPDIAVDQNGDLHVVWEERVADFGCGGNFCYHIYYKKGDVSGSAITWDGSPTVISNLSPAAGYAHAPNIVTQGNILHVSFARQVEVDPTTVNQYAYYTKYTPGSGWSTPFDTTLNNPVDVNTQDPFFLITTSAYCNNALYIYYHGALAPNDPNAKEQIVGSNNADNWTPRDEVTDAVNRDYYPSMACSSGKLYLAFERLVPAQPNQIYLVQGQANTAYLPVIRRP